MTPTQRACACGRRRSQLLRSDRRDRIFYALRDATATSSPATTSCRRRHRALRAGVPTMQNGAVRDEPVRVAALQIVDPRDAESDADRAGRRRRCNKRDALVEALRTQSVRCRRCSCSSSRSC